LHEISGFIQRPVTGGGTERKPAISGVFQAKALGLGSGLLVDITYGNILDRSN
jgi:hypothetical protein